MLLKWRIIGIYIILPRLTDVKRPPWFPEAGYIKIGQNFRLKKDYFRDFINFLL